MSYLSSIFNNFEKDINTHKKSDLKDYNESFYICENIFNIKNKENISEMDENNKKFSLNLKFDTKKEDNFNNDIINNKIVNTRRMRRNAEEISFVELNDNNIKKISYNNFENSIENNKQIIKNFKKKDKKKNTKHKWIKNIKNNILNDNKINNNLLNVNVKVKKLKSLLDIYNSYEKIKIKKKLSFFINNSKNKSKNHHKNQFMDKLIIC